MTRKRRNEVKILSGREGWLEKTTEVLTLRRPPRTCAERGSLKTRGDCRGEAGSLGETLSKKRSFRRGGGPLCPERRGLGACLLRWAREDLVPKEDLAARL